MNKERQSSQELKEPHNKNIHLVNTMRYFGVWK